jgi:hypothetical protein
VAEPSSQSISVTGAVWKVVTIPWALYELFGRVSKLDAKVDRLAEKVESLTERQSYLEGQIETLLPRIDGIVKLAVLESLKSTQAPSYEENMTEIRRNLEETQRILKESEGSARVIDEWLAKRGLKSKD